MASWLSCWWMSARVLGLVWWKRLRCSYKRCSHPGFAGIYVGSLTHLRVTGTSMCVAFCACMSVMHAEKGADGKNKETYVYVVASFYSLNLLLHSRIYWPPSENCSQLQIINFSFSFPRYAVSGRRLRMLLKRCVTVISEGSWRRENGSLQEKRTETDQPEVKTKKQKIFIHLCGTILKQNSVL